MDPKYMYLFKFYRGFVIDRDVFHDGNRNKIYDVIDEMADYRDREYKKLMNEWPDE